MFQPGLTSVTEQQAQQLEDDHLQELLVNGRHKRIVLPSPRVSVRPRNDELECLNEQIQISNLKNEISALERRNAELIVGIGKPQKKNSFKQIKQITYIIKFKTANKWGERKFKR